VSPKPCTLVLHKDLTTEEEEAVDTETEDADPTADQDPDHLHAEDADPEVVPERSVRVPEDQGVTPEAETDHLQGPVMTRPPEREGGPEIEELQAESSFAVL